MVYWTELEQEPYDPEEFVERLAWRTGTPRLTLFLLSWLKHASLGCYHFLKVFVRKEA